MEELKLFNAESIAEDLEIGKYIWELTAMFPKEKLGTIIKNRTKYKDRDGRRGYWTYVFVEKCDLKEELEQRGKADILEEYRSYLFLKYIKVLKTKIGDVKNINTEFKKYFVELFLNSYELAGDELQSFIQKETIELNTQKVSLDFQIDDLRRDLGISRVRIKELEETNNDLKKELQNKNRIINSFEDLEEKIQGLQRKTSIFAIYLIVFSIFSVVVLK